MYFVDCEASSLDSGSYPIEIAWVDEHGQGEGYLIQPEINWTNWSAVSERLHGLARPRLFAEGRPAVWVAQRALTVLSGHVLISDNPAFDEYWLGMLLATIPAPALPMSGHDALLTAQMHRMLRLNTAEPNSPEWHRQSRHLLDRGQTIVGGAQLRVTGARVRHRALPDAEALWYVWRLVKEQIDQIITE